MIKQNHEGYGKRLVETVTAIVIIGSPVATWAVSIVVGATSLFLYPHLPGSHRWEYMVASWVILIPPVTMIGMLTAVKLVNLFLVSAGMTTPRQPRDANGRYAPVLKNGKKVGYITVKQQNNGNVQ